MFQISTTQIVPSWSNQLFFEGSYEIIGAILVPEKERKNNTIVK